MKPRRRLQARLQRTHLDVVLQSSVQHGQVGQEGAQVRYSSLHHTLKRSQSGAVLLSLKCLMGSVTHTTEERDPGKTNLELLLSPTGLKLL